MAQDKPEQDGADKAILVYATFPNLAVAETIATRLLDDGLIACANLLPGMVALYSWQGARHRDAEVAAILKTRAGLAERVMVATKALHPYDNPALVVIAPVAGSADYFSWIAAETASARNSSDASPNE